MAFVHGKNAYFQLDNSAGTLTTLSSIANEVTYSLSLETSETSVFGSSAKTYIMGQNDATISLKGLFDQTTATTIEGAIDALVSNSLTSLKFVFGPQGSTTGQKKFSGTCIVTAYEIGSPVGDVVSLSLELQRTGATTIGTF
jgi:predicted secreted protein